MLAPNAEMLCKKSSSHLEQVDTTPVLLAAVATSGLPQVVGVREHGNPVADGRLDGGNGSGLVGHGSTSYTVAGGGQRGPASLHVPGSLARAESIGDGKLGEDEGSSVGSLTFSVEEGVQVDTDEVNHAAELGCRCLPGTKGLGGRDSTGVAGRSELGSDFGDEAGKC